MTLSQLQSMLTCNYIIMTEIVINMLPVNYNDVSVILSQALQLYTPRSTSKFVRTGFSTRLPTNIFDE